MGKLDTGLQLYVSDELVRTAEEAATYADDCVLIRNHLKSQSKGKEASKTTSPVNASASTSAANAASKVNSR